METLFFQHAALSPTQQSHTVHRRSCRGSTLTRTPTSDDTDMPDRLYFVAGGYGGIDFELLPYFGRRYVVGWMESIEREIVIILEYTLLQEAAVAV